MRVRNGEFYLGDCFDAMARLPDGCADMVLCDLPYGTTQNRWDAVIPFEPLWAEIWRLVGERSAVVLTAAQPFTSALVMSQVERFRYDWVWEKEPSNPLNAKRRPMPAHESVLVFGGAPYFPQGLRPTLRKRSKANVSKSANFGKINEKEYEQKMTGYPSTVLPFSKSRGFHPTQKPVALFEYLIRTYTEPGQVVLDMTAGSGTTAIAAERAGRRWICIERDEGYYWQAIARLAEGNE